MADTTAATATVGAPLTAPAPGQGSALSSTAPSTPAPELLNLASFDAEDLLAGTEPTAETTETIPGEEPEDDTVSPEADPSAEAEETPETEGEEPDETTPEADDTDDQPEGLKPKAIKRFNKLLAQRDEAKAAERQAKSELAALQARLEQRQDEPVPVNIASDPLAAVTNEEQLDAHDSLFKQIRSWCRRNPQGGTPPLHLTGGQEREFDTDEVVSNLEYAERMIDEVPKRRGFISEFRAKRAETRAAYPAVFTAGTPENETAHKLYPKLLNFATQADQDALLARLVKAELMEREERDGVARYTRVELKKPAASAKPAAKPAPKPAPTGLHVPPVKMTNSQTPQKAAWERVNAPLGSIDVEELLEVI